MGKRKEPFGSSPRLNCFDEFWWYAPAGASDLDPDHPIRTLEVYKTLLTDQLLVVDDVGGSQNNGLVGLEFHPRCSVVFALYGFIMGPF